MSLYPQQTTNPNVPEDVFLVAEVRTLTETMASVYFIDLEGHCWRVSGWASSMTRPVYPFQLCRLTGDIWKMIQARYDSWKRQREEEGTQMAEDPKATAQKIVDLAKEPLEKFVKKYQPTEAMGRHEAIIIEMSEAVHSYTALIHISLDYLTQGPEMPKPFQQASANFVASLFTAGYNAGVADTQKEERDAQVP